MILIFVSDCETKQAWKTRYRGEFYREKTAKKKQLFQRVFNGLSMSQKNKEMDKIKASKPSLLQATMYKKTMCKKQKADETLDSPLENI